MSDRFFGGDRADPIRGTFQTLGGTLEPPPETEPLVSETLARRAAALRADNDGQETGLRVDDDDRTAELTFRLGLEPCSECGKSHDRAAGEWFYYQGRKYCRGCAPAICLVPIGSV